MPHDCGDCLPLQQHARDNDLVATVLRADHDELARALHVRDHEGQRRFEEFSELMGLLTDDTMTRPRYTLADLLGYLEDQRKKGVPCGLCRDLFTEKQSAGEGVCGDCQEPEWACICGGFGPDPADEPSGASH